MTFGSLFSGGGGADIGAIAAGLTPIWGVEYREDIAGVYAKNIGDHIIVSDVCNVDPSSLPRPDVLWASPPCPSFSVAKSGGKETEGDIAVANAVCRFIRVHTPDYFFLENVQGYAKSQSLAMIRATLTELGYWHGESVLNSADYGVPQTRKRLILRASRDGWLMPMPGGGRWTGWYEAIEDLIPTLPESQLAPWQIRRLPKELTGSLITPVPEWKPVVFAADCEGDPESDELSCPVCGGCYADCPCPGPTQEDDFEYSEDGLLARPIRSSDAKSSFFVDCRASSPNHDDSRMTPLIAGDLPCSTITAEAHRALPVLVLVDGDNATKNGPIWHPSSRPATTVTQQSRPCLLIEGDAAGARPPTIRNYDKPAFTIKAENTGGRPRRAIIGVRVLGLTTRCLARFQSFPDSYWLPEGRKLAATVIGNAVPPLLAKAVIMATCFGYGVE